MSKDYKKLYEDVVALAKDGLSDGLYLSRSAKDVTEFLFPQLKKSENERISKKLIQLLQNGGRLPDEEHKQALSWLEKQGKIKLTHYDSAEKEKSDFVSGQFIQCRRSFNEFKEDESYLLEYIGDDTYIGRSDNILDEEFYITPRQLFTLFTHEHCPRTDSECEKKDEDNMKDKIIESLQRYMPTDELSEEQEMIAWLEKQGGKVDVLDDFPTEFERQISHLIASSINNEWEYKKDFVKHTANALLQYAKNELEKQGEQKSWSEEDEKIIKRIDSLLYSQCTIHGSEYEGIHNWLKSLKPNHWKPSEEQMGALNYAYCELFKRGENGEGSNCVHPLMTLIDDLKKL